MFLFSSYLDCVLSSFLGANANRLFNPGNEDFAIAGLSGPGAPNHRSHGRFGSLVHDNDFDPDLGHEARRVFAAAKELGRPLLATKAPHLSHRHPGDPQLAQGISDLLELVGFDYGFDLFHADLLIFAWPLALGMPCARNRGSAAKSPAFAGAFAREGFLEGWEEVLRFAQQQSFSTTLAASADAADAGHAAQNSLRFSRLARLGVIAEGRCPCHS